ncbi:MAG: SCO family protein [Candidatus Calescibacterium sp.]|nr:SCO family protein [Candidatus Calescibacterium sp.]
MKRKESTLCLVFSYLLSLVFFHLFFPIFDFNFVLADVSYPRELFVIGKKIPSVRLYNQDGEIVDLETLVKNSGKKVVILSPIYSNCPHACNPITQSLKDVVDEITKRGRNDFLVISLSFDEKDTKEDVERFIKRNEIEDFVSSGTWVVLFGPEFQKILDAIDFKIERKGEIIDHPNLIVFLTNDLRISGFLYGTYYYVDDVERKLDEVGRTTIFFVLLRNFFPILLGFAIVSLILVSVFVFKMFLPQPRKR